MSEPHPNRKRPRSIVAAVLDDGRVVETLYDAQTGKTFFTVAQDGGVDQCGSVDLGPAGHAVPYPASNSLLAHEIVLLPSAAESYASDAQLVSDVRGFIHRYADLSVSFEEIATYYVLLTWVYDAFNELPYLRFKGDFGTGKSRCLQTIGSLCYRPMFASGASTVSPLFRIIDMFRGTLVVDEGDFRFTDEKAEIVKILNNGNAAGFPVLRSDPTPAKDWNPKAFVVFGPKIIATRRPFDDPALESRCITETLNGLPPRADIPLSLPRSFGAEARAVRNQLLMYRFKNRARLRETALVREPAIEPRIAQVMAPLVAIVDGGAARERVLAYARAMSRALFAERSTSIEAQILDIMWTMRRNSEALGVKRIAEEFEVRYGSEYGRPITPRWVGAQLRRRLSLAAIRCHGNFVIAPTENAKLQALFDRYGIGKDDSTGRADGTAGGSTLAPTLER